MLETYWEIHDELDNAVRQRMIGIGNAQTPYDLALDIFYICDVNMENAWNITRLVIDRYGLDLNAPRVDSEYIVKRIYDIYMTILKDWSVFNIENVFTYWDNTDELRDRGLLVMKASIDDEFMKCSWIFGGDEDAWVWDKVDIDSDSEVASMPVEKYIQLIKEVKEYRNL